MAEAGFDCVPCGTVWCGNSQTSRGMSLNLKNFPNLARYCKVKLPAERLAGFFMVPWCTSTKGGDYRFMAACDVTDIAKAFFEGNDQV